jgi:hypothetical protein
MSETREIIRIVPTSYRAPKDEPLSLRYLKAWRDRFKKTAESGGNLGAETWLRILNALLDDPVACDDWEKLPNSIAQAAALAQMAEVVLRKILDERRQGRKFICVNDCNYLGSGD